MADSNPFSAPFFTALTASLEPIFVNLFCCSLEHLKYPYKFVPEKTNIVKAIIDHVGVKVITSYINNISQPPAFAYKLTQKTVLSAVDSFSMKNKFYLIYFRFCFQKSILPLHLTSPHSTT